MSEEQVKSLLESVGAADCELAAPRSVEARVMNAFRARQAAQFRRRATAWGLTAAAVFTVALALSRVAFGPTTHAPAATVNASAPLKGASESQPIQRSEGAVVSATRLGDVSAHNRPAVSVPAYTPKQPAPMPREVVTEFFPLMDPAPPLDGAALFRVRVPASAMQAVGLPVREERLNDRVQADVVVGEEGLARAIRFVTVPMR